MSEPDAKAMNDDAYAGGARPNIREVVRDLTNNLGSTLVAVMAGNHDPGIVGQRARDARPAPDRAAESRLRLAHRV
jgi:hypothetical protein